MKNGNACTSILVGPKATVDGSIFIGRNEDCGTAFAPVVFRQSQAESAAERKYKAFNGLVFPLPDQAYRYTALPEADLTLTGAYASAGFNEVYVAMSATESVYGAVRALAFDPQVEKGIAEDAIPDLVLPYIRTAREGVERLGHLIAEYGSEEGNGILFADREEVWYMEIPTGHHWVAQKLPENAVAVAPNQVCIEAVDFNDPEQFMWSPGLQEFVAEHHLNPEPETFNFRHIFGTYDESDRIYNTARAWDAMRRLASRRLQEAAYALNSGDIPFICEPERKLSIHDVAAVLASHFNETVYDPLGTEGSERERRKYRPISVSKTQESHILQLLPGEEAEELRQVLWLSLGATAFAPHVPLFAHAHSVPAAYASVPSEVSLDSAYWLFRILAQISEQLRFEAVHDIANYNRDIAAYTEGRVTEVRKKLAHLQGYELKVALSKANNETVAEVMQRSKAHLSRLYKRAFDLSKLTFKMNTDL